MKFKNSVKRKNQNINKMLSLKFRFLITVIATILAITIFIGGLCLYEVDNYVQNQAENFVNVTCDNESARINDSLSNMEKSVKIMESYLMDFFTDEADVLDPALQQEVIASADKMFVDIAKHTSTSGAVSYYFRLDPTISDGKTGLFYSKLNGSEDFLSLEPTDITIYEKDDTEHVGWYWQPYEAGKAIWIKPYHNQNNNILMISYVIPMYIEDRFIGVVGMDFDYVVLSNMVHGIELYESGFAHLEIDGTVIHNNNSELEAKALDDSSKYLRTSKELVNGMTLVLSADYEDIQQIRDDITYEILFAVLILSALLMIIAVVVVKKIVDPLKKLTDASIKLSNGDYDVEIADSNTYEIKLLSMAFENMTKHLREREESLRLEANRDSLTGLRNTTSYSAWVTKFDKKIEIQNADFGVIVLDLNELKETNDKYGHAIGDKLIITAAQVIANTFKRSPVFRIGGDEFLVVLQNSDLENYDKLFAQFILDCANTFVDVEDAKIPIRIASGFSRFNPMSDVRFLDVFKRADDAMYENKIKTKCING